MFFPATRSRGNIRMAQAAPIGHWNSLSRRTAHFFRVFLIIVIVYWFLAPGAFFESPPLLTLRKQMVAQTRNFDNLCTVLTRCEHRALLPQVQIQFIRIREILVEFPAKLTNLCRFIVLGRLASLLLWRVLRIIQRIVQLRPSSTANASTYLFLGALVHRGIRVRLVAPLNVYVRLNHRVFLGGGLFLGRFAISSSTV